MAYQAKPTLLSQTEVNITVSNLMRLSGDYRKYNEKLILHFDGEVKNIVRSILNVYESEAEHALLMIAKHCHEQAIKCDGTLHYERYLASRSPNLSFDQPCHEYSEVDTCLRYEYLLCGKEHLLENIHQNHNRTAEDRRDESMWAMLWNETLLNCPAPTLFSPFASSALASFDLHLSSTPRYLFRAFDPKSSGKSNENVVASPASENRTIYSRIDILSLHNDFATTILDWHLNPWKCRDDRSQNPDNLMSWTSSLLYAIQYALYRRYRYGCASEDIKICVIDTTKFPRGQFVHAKRLLEVYYQSVKRADMRNSYNTRLLMYIYQNGEYLSQGLLSHKGRSCLVTLAHLEKNGLCSIYPELADPRGHTKWAIRTIHLRRLWADQQATTYEEIQKALWLAKSCFQDFNELEIATILLSFKHRKLNCALSGK